MGDGTFQSSSLPVLVDLPAPASELSVGGSVPSNGGACAMAEGHAYCWGDDQYSQLGDGGTTNSAEPVEVVGVPQAASVYAGGQAGYAVDSSGNLYSWGADNVGQLGDGKRDGVPHPAPTIVDANVNMFSVTDNTAADEH
jgi:alpha-tubulin suppressor-like RCC1 family protein